MPKPLSQSEQKRQNIVLLTAQHLLVEGFGNSGLRALAKSANTSDRMLMYYFDTKDELIAEALVLLAGELEASLQDLLPPGYASGTKIIEVLIAAGLTDEVRPILSLWFEIVGLAIRGKEPYKSTANMILSGWEKWITLKLKPEQRHRAPVLLAQVEGALMIELLKPQGA